MANKLQKNIKNSLSSSLEDVHSPFEAKTIDFLDQIKILIIEENGNSLKGTVLKMSPVGIEVQLQSNLNLQDKYEIDITLGKQKIKLDARLLHFYNSDDFYIYSFRTFEKNETEVPFFEKREKKRWTCLEKYLPTGTTPNPIGYNDYIFFKIIELSHSGIKLITSLRNKTLISKQRLDCALNFPMVGSLALKIEIRNIDKIIFGGEEVLSLGCILINPDHYGLQTIAEYLLNFGKDVCLSDLKNEGFPIKSTSKWLDYTYVKSENEFDDVLELRHLAYSSAGKISKNKNKFEMTDEFDAIAKIIAVKHNSKIVGSARIMIHNQGDSTEFGKYTKFPESFPKIWEYVEVSRICTNPDIRGYDVLYEILSHIILLTVKANRRYAVGGAAGSLLDFYKKAGWTVTDIIYKSQALKQDESKIIILDTHKVVLANKIKLKDWKRMFSGVIDYMIEQEILILTPIELLRVKYLKFLSKFIK